MKAKELAEKLLEHPEREVFVDHVWNFVQLEKISLLTLTIGEDEKEYFCIHSAGNSYSKFCYKIQEK